MSQEQTASPSRQPLAGAGATLSRLRDDAEFLRGFLRSPAQVGSVVPSSHRLEQRLVRNAGIAQARTVVELGPGTGGTTAALLRALPASGQLLAVELDARFHRYLGHHLQDPRLSVQFGSAERLLEFLQARRLPLPDAIVSGIPFSTMPREVAQAIASQVAQALRPGGRFVAYQVRADVAGYLTPHLGRPVKEWELLNVPPLRVFTWVKG